MSSGPKDNPPSHAGGGERRRMSKFSDSQEISELKAALAARAERDRLNTLLCYTKPRLRLHWSFSEDQRHTHTWHTKEDFLVWLDTEHQKALQPHPPSAPTKWCPACDTPGCPRNHIPGANTPCETESSSQSAAGSASSGQSHSSSSSFGSVAVAADHGAGELVTELERLVMNANQPALSMGEPYSYACRDLWMFMFKNARQIAHLCRCALCLAAAATEEPRLECVQCGEPGLILGTENPQARIDGWLCPTCYAKLNP